MSTNDREMLEMAARALPDGYYDHKKESVSYSGFDAIKYGWAEWTPWNPLADDGDALRLAVKLRINIIFSGSFHYVGTERNVIDVCNVGGREDIRYGIVRAAAEIGRAMP